MSHSSTASSAARLAPSAPAANSDPQKPANDHRAPTVASEKRPSYALSAAKRAHCLALAMAVDPSQVKRVPTWVHEHLNWMDGVQGSAWHDRREMATVKLGGVAAGEAEIDDLGFRIEFVRDVIAEAEIPIGAVTTRDPAQMSDEAITAEMLLCQAGLCDAITPYLKFSKALPSVVDEQRAAVAAVRRGRAEKDFALNNKRLFRLGEDVEILGYLRGLPKGEITLLERLKELHAEWSRRTADGASAAHPTGAPKDLVARAYAVALEPIARITAAGRYLVKGRADRKGAYPGFRRPKKRKAVAPKVVAQQPAATTTDAAPPTTR